MTSIYLSFVAMTLGLLAIAVAWRNRWKRAAVFTLAALALAGLTLAGWDWLNRA